MSTVAEPLDSTEEPLDGRGTSTAASSGSLPALRARVAGPVLARTDPGYGDEVVGFNLAYPHSPDVVVGATCTADVVAAVAYAAEQGLPVGVQATGHGIVTTVDSDASETAPIVNVASIVSHETPKDEGQDSIRVTSESLQGGQSTPKPSVPNTALAFGPAGEPISIPVEFLVVLFLGSLGALAFANVRAARRRR